MLQNLKPPKKQGPLAGQGLHNNFLGSNPPVIEILSSQKKAP